MTAKSLRRRLSHLFKHAPATSAISPIHVPRKIRGEKPYYQHPHPFTCRSSQSAISALLRIESTASLGSHSAAPKLHVTSTISDPTPTARLRRGLTGLDSAGTAPIVVGASVTRELRAVCADCARRPGRSKAFPSPHGIALAFTRVARASVSHSVIAARPSCARQLTRTTQRRAGQ